MNNFHFNQEVLKNIKNKLLFNPASSINYIISLPFYLPIKDKTVFDIHFKNQSTLYIFNTFFDKSTNALFP